MENKESIFSTRSFWKNKTSPREKNDINNVDNDNMIYDIFDEVKRLFDIFFKDCFQFFDLINIKILVLLNYVFLISMFAINVFLNNMGFVLFLEN